MLSILFLYISYFLSFCNLIFNFVIILFFCLFVQVLLLLFNPSLSIHLLFMLSVPYHYFIFHSFYSYCFFLFVSPSHSFSVPITSLPLFKPFCNWPVISISIYSATSVITTIVLSSFHHRLFIPFYFFLQPIKIYLTSNQSLLLKQAKSCAN